MSNILGAGQTVALVERLRDTVRDFTEREEKLNKEIRTKLNIEQQRRNKALEELTAAIAQEVARENEINAGESAALESKIANRQTRITQAHNSTRKRALQWVEDREGSRKNKLQIDTLQAHRTRDTGLALVQKTCEDFSKKLFAEEDKLVPLENSARSSFSGYGDFRKMLATAPLMDQQELSQDENSLFIELQKQIKNAEEELARFRGSPFPHLFKRRLWLSLLIVLTVPAAPLIQKAGYPSFDYAHAGASAAVVLALGVGLHVITRRLSEQRARTIAQAITKARKLVDLCREKAERRFKEDYEQTTADFQNRIQTIESDWAKAVEQAAEQRESRPCELDKKATRINAKHTTWRKAQETSLAQKHAARLESMRRQAEGRNELILQDFAAREARLSAELQTRMQALETEWKTIIPQLYRTIEELGRKSATLFPEWNSTAISNWSSPQTFVHAAHIARWEIEVEKMAGGLPNDSRLALPGGPKLSLPVTLVYPESGSLLIETNHAGHDSAIGALNSAVLRLLSVAPAGRLSFTIVDPVGLGQNFSGIMHLADYADHLINKKIWTQAGQIEQRLGELNEHMEKVIQMYLRNEYTTIAEYNEHAGNIAEKYHFLVVADFPVNFTEVAAKRLLSIATSGARCGVYTLIHWNANQPLPPDFVSDELRKSSVCINAKGDRLYFAGKQIPGTNIVLDAPPATETAIEFINRVGALNRDSNRIEVPFSHVAPPEGAFWSEETSNELRVPIGRTGATKLQYLEMGRGTRQHALLAGKTGSGKSTLFHVLITNLALWCSPEQVEFYLIDFKKGVEFKCYATNKLPHARVVAIESDREFGLSVLQRLDEELRRRGELFRKMGVQDIAGYKKAGGTEPMPRSLLIIDEFQEYFVEDDKISQNASMLLDRIVRQGRAFGIHVFLGSQTLGGAYTMARTTIGQMVIRIALQCNEADSYLIMDDSNPAPRLLTRPGEGIYNDEAGALHGNSPFQTVWLPDEVRDGYLKQVGLLAAKTGKQYPTPVVFEGNAPANIAENEQLQQLLQTGAPAKTSSPRIWLGAPNAIKGPTEAVFHRQGGNHLLIVGQNEEAVLAIFTVGLISLASQRPAPSVRFIILDGNPADSGPRAYLQEAIRGSHRQVSLVKPNELPATTTELVTEMKRRQEDEKASEAPVIFVLIQGLQKFSKLRYEDDFSFSNDDSAEANPAKQLNQLICEGSSVGIHVILSCDSYNNVNRFLSKKAINNFGMRILFQMGANDSASLIESPKASTLGMHRALFYNEQEGHLETFRPYALPSQEWLEGVNSMLG